MAAAVAEVVEEVLGVMAVLVAKVAAVFVDNLHWKWLQGGNGGGDLPGVGEEVCVGREVAAGDVDVSTGEIGGRECGRAH